MQSVWRLALVVVLGVYASAPARADYCDDWLATLVRTVDMNADRAVHPGGAKSLNVTMSTRGKNYEVVLHCLGDGASKWITVAATTVTPPDDWYSVVGHIGTLQGWKPEDIDKAARDCHRRAALKNPGYAAPPGLECWVSRNRSQIALWPPGTK